MDRGPSSYLSNVDVFLDGHLITTVQGDGECCWAPLEGKQLHFTGSKHKCAKDGCVHSHSEALGAERFCWWACEGT